MPSPTWLMRGNLANAATLLSKKAGISCYLQGCFGSHARNFTRLDSIVKRQPEQFKNSGQTQTTSERTRMLEYVPDKSTWFCCIHPDYFIEWFEKEEAHGYCKKLCSVHEHQKTNYFDKRIEQKPNRSCNAVIPLFFSVVAVCLVVIFLPRLRKQTILRFSTPRSEAKFEAPRQLKCRNKLWTTDETSRLNYF